MTTRLRIGILGTANIASAFMIGARQAASAEVIAIASRDRSRADAFARTHHVPRGCTYDELLRDREIDAVYIPLPNSLHPAWTIAAARAGKHVLCEKPLAANEPDAEAMFAAGDANAVVIVEAFPYMFQPQTLEIERLIREGAIGDVEMMFATFGFPLRDTANIRLDAALGGGALLDVGCYPVSFVRQVFGARPHRVTAVARFAGDVDQTLAATLQYPTGIAQISCSFATAVHRRAIIAGSRGVIETDYHNHTDRSAAPSYRIKRSADAQAEFETVAVIRDDGFRLEIEAFAAMIASTDRTASHARRTASLDNAWTLQTIAASALAR